jgi:predicted peroxiredoxin
MQKALINLATGLEDPERATVAMLVASGSAARGKETIVFLTKEAVRLAQPGFGAVVACEGCPPLPELLDRFDQAGGRYFACPYCVDARHVDRAGLKPNAEIGGISKIWEWAGEDSVLALSY